jgi:hypothetical protein
VINERTTIAARSAVGAIFPSSRYQGLPENNALVRLRWLGEGPVDASRTGRLPKPSGADGASGKLVDVS